MIGWVYESNREKVRAAENELNDFYRQDNIDDLNNAKDAELQALDESIKNWEDYLAMLNEKYNEYNILQEQQLLQELLGVETQEEVYRLIQEDMTNFTLYVEANTASFLENQSAAYLAFNSSFNSFLEDYKDNLMEFQKLKEIELKLMNSSSYLSLNNASASVLGGLNNASASVLGNLGSVTIKPSDSYGSYTKYSGGTSDYGFGDAVMSNSNDAVNLNENYTALANEALAKNDPEMAKVYADLANAKVNSDDYTGSIREVKLNPETGKYEGIKKDGYSDGLHSGPVTYTGLAMLHGTPNSPEYVLNNDQAYNLLYNLATRRMPEFETKSTETGTQYIVQGDIILEGVDNPEEFWGEVTKAMGNRWNVTKNR